MSNDKKRDDLAEVIAAVQNVPFAGTRQTKIANAALAHLFPVLTTPEELDELPIESVIACISHVANVPVCIVFQRGSQENLGNGWTTPDALGQITSEQVFQLVGLNGFPPAITVLHRP